MTRAIERVLPMISQSAAQRSTQASPEPRKRSAAHKAPTALVARKRAKKRRPAKRERRQA
jgi:hypothetical protein